MNMRDHSNFVEWAYTIPPHDKTRVLIHQRQDGPFRNDAAGGAGHYYVSIERLAANGKWEHVPGTSQGGLRNFQAAARVAEEKWEQERTS